MNEEYLNDQEVAALEEMESLKGALTEGETPEEKRIRDLLDNTSDEGLRATLNDRLEEIQSANSIDVEEVIDRLQGIGYSHAAVLRHGITKIVQQIKWRAKNREAKKEA